MTRHIMLDLETLSRRNTAAVASIGAVEFDPGTGDVVDTFYRAIDLDCYDGVDGFHVEFNTIKWWLKQPEPARRALLDDAVTAHEALSGFQKFLGVIDGEDLIEGRLAVWGNGASNGAIFDNAVVKNMLTQFGFDPFWTYKDDYCYRTIKNLHHTITIDDAGVKHHTKDDAIYQVKHISKILSVTGFDL